LINFSLCHLANIVVDRWTQNLSSRKIWFVRWFQIEEPWFYL